METVHSPVYTVNSGNTSLSKCPGAVHTLEGRKSLSRVPLFATPGMHQVPLFMGFPRQEYWSGLPFPSPGVFPSLGTNLTLLHYRHSLYHLSYSLDIGKARDST